MPKTLDFTGFSGNLPLKKKAGFTRCNKKAISYYMFLYPQARPDLMRAGVCVILRYDAAGGKGYFLYRLTQPRRGRRNLYKDQKRRPPGSTTQIFAKFKRGIDHRRGII